MVDELRREEDIDTTVYTINPKRVIPL